MGYGRRLWRRLKAAAAKVTPASAVFRGAGLGVQAAVGGAGTGLAPTFYAPLNDSGTHLVSKTPDVNGSAAPLEFWYDAADASTTPGAELTTYDDDFDNATLDFSQPGDTQNAGNGALSEPVGTSIHVDCPNGVSCSWNHLVASMTAPRVAKDGANLGLPSPSGSARLRRYECRCTGFGGNNDTLIGLYLGDGNGTASYSVQYWHGGEVARLVRHNSNLSATVVGTTPIATSPDATPARMLIFHNDNTLVSGNVTVPIDGFSLPADHVVGYYSDDDGASYVRIANEANAAGVGMSGADVGLFAGNFAGTTHQIDGRFDWLRAGHSSDGVGTWDPLQGTTEQLALIESGAVPVAGKNSPFLGQGSSAVRYSGGATGMHFEASGDVTLGNIGATDDVIIEACCRPVAGGTIWSKEDGSKSARLYWSGDAFHFRVDDGVAAAVTASSTADFRAGVYHTVSVQFDHSGSCRVFANGVDGGTDGVVSGVGDLSTATAMRVGGRAGDVFDGDIAYVAMWRGAAFLDTHARNLDVAVRNIAMTGFIPTIMGTQKFPNTSNRTDDAYTERVIGDEAELHKVGEIWLRIAERVSASGKIFKGYLSESSRTNICLRNTDLSDVAWTKTNASAPAVSQDLPDSLTSSTAVLHEDATAATTHSVSQGIALAATTTYTVSGWARAINRDWVKVQFALTGAAGTKSVSFDVANGTVGTTNGSLVGTPGVRKFVNGWYRWWFTFTTTDAATDTLTVFAAPADDTETFNGLDQDSVGVWGVQVEAAVAPSSLIETAGTSAIRTQDRLRFKGDDGALVQGQGSIAAHILLDDQDSALSQFVVYANNSGGFTANRIILYRGSSIAETGRALTTATAGNGGTVQGTTDLSDGEIHKIRTTYETNALNLYVDGSTDGPQDSVVDPPVNIDRIPVGMDPNELNQFDGLISHVEIWPKPTTATRGPVDYPSV